MVSFCQLVYFSLGVTCYVTTRSKVFQLPFWMFFSNAIKYEFTASTKIIIIPCSCYTAHSNGSPKNLFYFDVTTNHMTNHSNAYVLAKNQHNKRTKPKLDDNFYT
mmetsp:Transcript_18318/g.37143  ORF Transcript_18318/g.37143 Transcript_18318/m.37143 type:complete len:105 (+) Transcript_18318:156-470(+)